MPGGSQCAMDDRGGTDSNNTQADALCGSLSASKCEDIKTPEKDVYDDGEDEEEVDVEMMEITGMRFSSSNDNTDTKNSNYNDNDDSDHVISTCASDEGTLSASTCSTESR